MSLYSDLNEVLTPYAQKIKGLAAADEELKADLGCLIADVNDTSIWELGGISSSNGEGSVSTTRLRTINYIGKVKVVPSIGYKYIVCAYNDGAYVGMWNGTSFVKSATWLTDMTDIAGLDSYDYKLIFANTSNGAITVADSANITLLLSTDDTLTEGGKSADAGATGKALRALEDQFSEETDKIKADLNDVYEFVDFYSAKDGDNYTWDIGYTINASGDFGISKYTSTSKRVKKELSQIGIINSSNAVGMNSKSTLLIIAEYSDANTFTQRSILGVGESLLFRDDTTIYRIIFGYYASSGNTATLEDLSENFAVKVINNNVVNTLNNRSISAIGSGTDLNNLRMVGTYYATVDIAGTLLNSPTITGFKMIVEDLKGNNENLIQYVLPQSSVRFSEICYRIYSKSTGFSNWTHASATASDTIINDHLYKVGIVPMEVKKVLVDQNGEIVEGSDAYVFSGYLHCPKYLIFETKNANDRIVIYFYEKINNEYVLRWDVLNITTYDGIKNYFGGNGHNKVISVPDNTYMRVAIVNTADSATNIYGWDGEHIGWPIVSTVETVDTNTLVDDPNNANLVGITLPGETKMVFSKDMLIIDIFGRKPGNPYELLERRCYYHSYAFPEGYAHFRLTLGFNCEASRTALVDLTYDRLTEAVDLSDSISTIVDYTPIKEPFGRAEAIIQRAEAMCRVPWTCLKTKKWNSHEYYFKQGENYAGVPYVSQWEKVAYVGWHCSMRTFLSAANDSDSKFYKENSRTGYAFGWGLVCSSFASLISGYPYPIVTTCLLRDPQMRWDISYEPEIGSIMYNNDGHCLIPAFYGGNDQTKIIAQYEQANPTTSLRMGISDYKSSRVPYTYIQDYIYKCYHTKATKEPQGYDITTTKITNGDARPYTGDRGVFTSEDDVRINIKNEEASILYVRQCSYDSETKRFAFIAPAVEITIPSGATYIDLDKTALSDASFYAVYTDSKPNVYEFFEYHIVNQETFRMVSNNIEFSNNDFWYCLWWTQQGTRGHADIIPKLDDGDYSAYLNAGYDPTHGRGHMFFRGVLGAYVVDLIQV